MSVRKEPCHECAFLRTCPPGLLGGSPVETYIGQALGPFSVPCHLQTDFRDPEWKDKAWDVQQCGGLAVFRTNIGIADRMPDALPCLPASSDVFATMAEFVAHHLQIPLATPSAGSTRSPRANI